MAAAKNAAKKAEKKTRTEKEYQELRASTTELARCAILTLGSDGKLGVGSGMMLNLKTRNVEHWSTQFFDALDSVGIVYDREKYFKKKPKR